MGWLVGGWVGRSTTGQTDRRTHVCAHVWDGQAVHGLICPVKPSALTVVMTRSIMALRASSVLLLNISRIAFPRATAFGARVGSAVGNAVSVGAYDGLSVVGGSVVGCALGGRVSRGVGTVVGVGAGTTVGSSAGVIDGCRLGGSVGLAVRILVSTCVGKAVGDGEGFSVGAFVGEGIGEGVGEGV